ncbi:pumilio homolog 1-like [Babylonia areolata]|uniref:pumilio homolog 1-like n=1 Tax=Babylonia areolata TaxID=304850 RepID=UPI003FCFB581
MSWDDSVTTRAQNMAMRTNQVRSQDDHSVEYYGRPQNQMSMGFGSRRGWGVNSGMDDSVLGDGRGLSQGMHELESRIHSMDLNGPRETVRQGEAAWASRADAQWQNVHVSKKMWSLDDSNKPDNRGYAAWGHRDDSGWGGAPAGMSQTGSLGLNMAEFVLGGSPTNRSNIVDRNRMTGAFGPVPEVEEKKEKTPSPFEEGEDKDLQANGIMQNGLEDAGFRGGSRQNSPNGGEVGGLRTEADFLDSQGLGQQGFQLDPNLNQFNHMAIDPMSFDYTQVLPSVDSPNFNMDYSQLMQRQQQQQQQQVLAQQYALAQQQQQMGLPSLPGPYVISAQESYPMAGIPIAGPAMIHAGQYPYLQTTPWGIYAPSLMQQGTGQQTPGQQQPQMMRGQGGRPLTPNQQGESMGTPNPPQINTQTLQTQNPAYQLMTPTYMMDQNGQLLLGGPRNMGVRLVSPHTSLLVPAAAPNQQGGASSMAQSPLRLLTTQTQQIGTPPVMSNSANSSVTNSTLGFSPTSTLSYTTVTPSVFPPITANLGLQNGFGNSGLGQLNTSAPGTIGQRRESFEVKRPQLNTMGSYYGSALGNMAPSPAGPGSMVPSGPSMTPPPTLSGSSSTVSINACGTGRPYSAAPGAEAKYRGNLISPNGFFPPNSIFPTRMAPRSASMSKEVTGRSRLLEDFRNNRIPNLQLKDLFQHVVEFSQDQHGSRFIQQKLERATPQEKAMVFTEILNSAYSLMTDVFGNYVIQKFFEYGTPEQKQTLAQRVRGHVLPLALQMYGCRVIQKALESIPAEMQVEVVKELEGHVLKCVKDQNGNHVVQKCIECVDPAFLQFILDAFKGNVFTLSTHPYGCRVIQRILEHCTVEQTTSVLAEMHEQTERLVQDQYGNYVIQHVLEHGRQEDKSKIVACIQGKVLIYSQHKFASNVVEKCVTHSTRQEKTILIDEILTQNEGHHSALYTMMKDQFANYVVQKMIDVAEAPQRKMLMFKIRPHMSTLRKYTYGKHILAKLEKFFMKTSPELQTMGMPPNGALQ